MEQVFDFRVFMLTLLRKGKNILIFALILLLLGAGYGFYSSRKAKYTTTVGGSVNIIRDANETSPLTDMMKNIDSVTSDNYFYTGLINTIQAKMPADHYSTLIGHMKNPSVDKLKPIIKVYTKGNLILIDVTSDKKDLTIEAGHAAIAYVIGQMGQYNQNIKVIPQAEQTVDAHIQQGTTAKSQMLKYGLVAFAAGIILAILWVFFVNVFDLRIKNENDLKKYSLPILGVLKKEA